MQDASIPAATAEIVIQQAIDSLNTFGAGINSLSGSPGTLAATSMQSGAIGLMAKEIYSRLFMNATNANSNISGMSLTYSNDSQLLSFARTLAFQLKARSFERT